MERVYAIGYKIARYQLERDTGWLSVLSKFGEQICSHLPLEDVWRTYTKTCRALRDSIISGKLNLHDRVQERFNLNFYPNVNIFSAITLNRYHHCLGGCGNHVWEQTYMIKYCMCQICFRVRYKLIVTYRDGKVRVRKRKRIC